ncbi:hypothetical protein ACQPX6_08525 [Actinomycetospora sp. CA-101289]|uniref:hypothetical protein n=1 Tax=Actinomycetospora sp. CA-101289 TaxID=3239893 RepID=UPI003D96C826
MRAVAFGLLAVVFGLAAHEQAGGTVLGGGTAALVAALVVLGTALVGALPPHVARTPTVLASGQLALHLSLSSSMGTDQPLHTMHAPTPHGPGMLLAHLAVAVVLAVGIVHADRAVLRVSDLWVRRVAVTWWAKVSSSADIVIPAPDRPRSTVGSSPAVKLGPRLRAVDRHPRRGPPSGGDSPTMPLRDRGPPCPTP